MFLKSGIFAPIYKIRRRMRLNDIITKIGKIEETDSEIICYVTQNLLKKNGDEVFRHLFCTAVNTVTDDESYNKIKHAVHV